MKYEYKSVTGETFVVERPDPPHLHDLVCDAFWGDEYEYEITCFECGYKTMAKTVEEAQTILDAHRKFVETIWEIKNNGRF